MYFRNYYLKLYLGFIHLVLHCFDAIVLDKIILKNSQALLSYCMHTRKHLIAKHIYIHHLRAILAFFYA